MNGTHVKDHAAASAYVDRLQTKGATEPVDVDPSSITITLPPWYDEALFKRAQRFHDNNLFSMFAGKLCGLLAVLAVPSILKILIHTKASSTSLTAYKRYMQTVFHTLTWYEYDLKPGTRLWTSIESVRKGHCVASRYANKGSAGFISQKDMALTQFGFMGFIVLKPHRLGVQVCRENLEAFVHFWRVMGYMFGIKDEYNLCADSLEMTLQRLQIISDDVYRPLLEQTSPDFMSMSKALIEALWCFNPMLDTNASIYFVKWMTDCKNYVYFESDPRASDHNLDDSRQILNSFNWYTRWIIFVQITSHTYLTNFFIFRWYFNSQVWLAKHIIYWFPFLAIYLFGLKAAYVRILRKPTNVPTIHS